MCRNSTSVASWLQYQTRSGKYHKPNFARFEFYQKPQPKFTKLDPWELCLTAVMKADKLEAFDWFSGYITTFSVLFASFCSRKLSLLIKTGIIGKGENVALGANKTRDHRTWYCTVGTVHRSTIPWDQFLVGGKDGAKDSVTVWCVKVASSTTVLYRYSITVLYVLAV